MIPMLTTKKTNQNLKTLPPENVEITPDLTNTNSPSDTSACAHADKQAGSTMLKLKLINLAAVLIPFIGFVAAMVLSWGVAFNWIYLGLFGGMYIVTTIGVTIGYHRYFTHRSFKTSKPMVFLLAACGSMAVEGPVLQWVADHRRHHQHSDEDGDPHSPHLHDDGFWGSLKGMWHAHLGWLVNPQVKGSMRYVGDLRKDKLVRRMSKLFPFWVLVGLAIPAVLGGILTWSWMGVLLGFIWGGLVRIFIVHHVTWSINSVCHIWGQQPFETQDHSRNNIIMGVFAMGEGWHNNHHAFQSSARHGLRWWELDVSYMLIVAMSKVGLVSDIKVPSKERVLEKRKS
jgi:stearoyl-CoA desaturase (delta-9 desaturase)